MISISTLGGVAALLLATTSPSQAEGIYYSGLLLLKYCTSETQQMTAQKLVDFGFCGGFISAVIGASRCGANIYGFSSDIPKTVTVDDLKVVVIKWLIQHPEKLQTSAEGLVAQALNEFYPCPP
jgi:hypothetical protein